MKIKLDAILKRAQTMTDHSLRIILDSQDMETLPVETIGRLGQAEGKFIKVTFELEDTKTTDDIRKTFKHLQ